MPPSSGSYTRLKFLMVVIVGAVLAGRLIIDVPVLDHEPPPEPAAQNGALSGHKG